MKRANQIETLVSEEKKRITDIVNNTKNKPVAKLTPEEEKDYDDIEQKQVLLERQKELDDAYIDDKIVNIFKTYKLTLDADDRESDGVAVWGKLQSKSENDFWKKIIDALPFIDVTLKDSKKKETLLTTDDITRIVGEGTFTALQEAFQLRTSLTYGRKEYNVLKQLYFEYVLGYNEDAATHFLTLMVHYRYLKDSLIPVMTMLSYAHHDDRSSNNNNNNNNNNNDDDDPNKYTTIPKRVPKYEIDKTYQYFTMLDLFRNNLTKRYLFYQLVTMDENINEPLVIQVNNDDSSKRMIETDGLVTGILKFYHNNKILLFVETRRSFLLKISCDNLTTEKVDDIQPLFTARFNDNFYIDANRIYESTFCSNIKSSPAYAETQILDIRKMFNVINVAKLTDDEKKLWNVLTRKFIKNPDQDQDDQETAAARLRYTELTNRKNVVPRNLMVAISGRQSFSDAVSEKGVLYYDPPDSNQNVEPMTSKQVRVLGCKVVSLPTHRNQDKYVTVAILVEKHSNLKKHLLFMHFRKYQFNIQQNKYVLFGDPVMLELRSTEENGISSGVRFDDGDFVFKVLDFDLYFFTNDTFFIQIFFENIEGPGEKFYVKNSSFNFEKFLFSKIDQGDSPAVTTSQLILAAMKYDYRIIRYDNHDPLTMKFDHVLLKNRPASDTCRVIFAKLNTTIVVVYQIDLVDININDIISITPLANQQDGFAYIRVRFNGQVNILKIVNGNGYKDYESNDESFLRSSFSRFNLNNGGSTTTTKITTMKKSNICSFCGSHTTKLDNLTHNYYCDPVCQLLFCTTKRMV
jgi:hypothetical protein